MTDAMTPTLKPMPLNKSQNVVVTEGCEDEFMRRTILLVNPPLVPRTHCEVDENIWGIKEETVTYSNGHTAPVSELSLFLIGREDTHLLGHDVLAGRRF
jgi:hypothetical protein